jgi:hypothetical protein
MDLRRAILGGRDENGRKRMENPSPIFVSAFYHRIRDRVRNSRERKWERDKRNCENERKRKLSVPRIRGTPLLQYKDAARRTAPRPHHMGRFRGTTWQGKIIHPRVHYRVRTSAEEHRTPVRTTRTFDYSPGLPRRYVKSLRWAPGSSE